MPRFNVDHLVAALVGKQPLVFEPEWHGEIEGYTVNYVQKHYWRVQRTMPREDVMQEAVCVFLRCKRRYQVREPKHFMALYKTALSNAFNDWSTADTEDRVMVYDVLKYSDHGEIFEQIITEPRVGEIENDGYLATMIRQAPQEVLMVLNLMLRAPQELIEEVLAAWTGNEDPRSKANGSKRINELLGLPLDQDTLGAVRSYFR